MRALAWFVVYVMLMPAAMAQTPLMDDPAGDVSPYVHGMATPLKSPGNGAVDLRALHVTESLDSFEFHIEVESGEPPESATQFEIRFDYGEAHYLVDLYGLLVGTAGGLNGFLLRATSNGYERIVELEPELEPAGGVTVSVPRHHVMDQHGASPRVGDLLRDVQVLSRATEFVYLASDSGAVALRDRMPDAGEGPAYESVVGLQQSGDARLTSPEPMRYSNGEATTFVYTVTAHNEGRENQSFSFGADGVPDGWEVVFPASAIRLDAGDVKDVTVVVQLPFEHRHGEAATFLVEMVGQRDAGDVGRIQLGVRYPDTPQPSGHHPQMWLHAQTTSRDPFALATYALGETLGGIGQQDLVYMNTLEDDPLSEDIPAKGAWCDTLWADAPDPVGGDNVPAAAVYCWQIPLSPALRVGLDLDMAGTGTIEVPIHSTLPAERAWLGGHLVYMPPDASMPGPMFGQATPPEDAIILAQLLADQNVTFNADSTVQMSATIVPLDAGDRVPYKRDGSLWLWLNVTQQRPETVIGPKADKPAVTPGGTLALPLVDYADSVDVVFGDTQTVALRTVQAHRWVNPGETVVFDVNVENRQERSGRFDLRLLGNGAHWGRIASPADVSLDTGESGTVLVAITAPADAGDGVRADLILEATSVIDPNVRSMLRLVAEVDHENDHEDESGRIAQAGTGKEAPALPVGLAVFDLGLLSRRLRA